MFARVVDDADCYCPWKKLFTFGGFHRLEKASAWSKSQHFDHGSAKESRTGI